VPLSEIPAGEPVRSLVEKYDPATQAIVVIEYEAGCVLEHELVEIRDPALVEIRDLKLITQSRIHLTWSRIERFSLIGEGNKVPCLRGYLSR